MCLHKQKHLSTKQETWVSECFFFISLNYLGIISDNYFIKATLLINVQLHNNVCSYIPYNDELCGCIQKVVDLLYGEKWRILSLNWQTLIIFRLKPTKDCY